MAPPHTLSSRRHANKEKGDLSSHKMRVFLILVTLTCLADAQHQALMDYLERRLLAIEVRDCSSAPSQTLGSRISLKGNSLGIWETFNGMQMWGF